MGQVGRVGPDASHRWEGRWRRADPVGPVQTCADVMCRPAPKVDAAAHILPFCSCRRCTPF
jgi:hypothetical protein